MADRSCRLQSCHRGDGLRALVVGPCGAWVDPCGVWRPWRGLVLRRGKEPLSCEMSLSKDWVRNGGFLRPTERPSPKLARLILRNAKVRAQL